MKNLFAKIAAFFRNFFKRSPAGPERLPVPVVYPKAPRSIFKFSVGKLIRVCPGKRHAWFESNVGPVRKQI